MECILAHNEETYKAAAALFREYANWLQIDLCFQNFETELTCLDTMYALPHGGIVLLRNHTNFIACVGVRRFSADVAELKRMWVQPPFQRNGLGQQLLDHALVLAHNCGYHKIVLDTLRDMTPAISLYQKNGFVEIPAYYGNPNSGAVYMEKQL